MAIYFKFTNQWLLSLNDVFPFGTTVIRLYVFFVVNNSDSDD